MTRREMEPGEHSASIFSSSNSRGYQDLMRRLDERFGKDRPPHWMQLPGWPAKKHFMDQPIVATWDASLEMVLPDMPPGADGLAGFLSRLSMEMESAAHDAPEKSESEEAAERASWHARKLEDDVGRQRHRFDDEQLSAVASWLWFAVKVGMSMQRHHIIKYHKERQTSELSKHNLAQRKAALEADAVVLGLIGDSENTMGKCRRVLAEASKALGEPNLTAQALRQRVIRANARRVGP